MKWIRFFGNFEGRIPRKTFWLANIVVFVFEVIVAAIAAASVEGFAGETAGDMTMHIVTFAFLYPQFVIALKRAHDLEMSSQVIYAWYIVLAVYSVLVRFAGWLWINLTQNYSEYLLIGRAGICLCVHLRRRYRQPGVADRAWLPPRHARFKSLWARPARESLIAPR